MIKRALFDDLRDHLSKKEITKSPVYYFHDLGLRNFGAGFFGNAEAFIDPGFLFQNFIFLLLRDKIRDGPERISFRRTKDGAEVDFVVDSPVEAIPIEVKHRASKHPEVTRGFRSFLERHHPQKAYVINLTLRETVSINKTKVFFLPYYEILSVPSF